MKLWKSQKQNHQFQNAWMLFTEKRWESNKDSKRGWKSGISEFLSIYPVVLDVISRSRHAKDLPGEVQSFAELCDVLDYIQDLKHGRTNDTDKLQTLVEEHLRVHELVYGSEDWKPKRHAILHLSGQVKRDGGVVLDTILTERAHQKSHT